MFIPTWGDDPIWLIFFRWVETTNQVVYLSLSHYLRGFFCIQTVVRSPDFWTINRSFHQLLQDFLETTYLVRLVSKSSVIKPTYRINTSLIWMIAIVQFGWMKKCSLSWALNIGFERWCVCLFFIIPIYQKTESIYCRELCKKKFLESFGHLVDHLDS